MAGQDNQPAEADWQKQLDAIRKEVDALDERLAEMLCRRMEATSKLAGIKSALNMAIKDDKREQEVMSRIAYACVNKDLQPALVAVYQSIMSESRKIQVARSLNNEGFSPSQADVADGKVYFPSVLIIGLGLMGGAFARQIRQRLPKTQIAAIDQAQNLSPALEDGVINAAHLIAGQLDVKLIESAQLIILAAGPEDNLQILAAIAAHLKASQLVFDLTSVKSPICKLADELDLHGADFIGGHPFFGSEKKGYLASGELTLNGQLFCLTPTEKSSEISLRRLLRWLQDLGLKVETLSPAEHDQIAANLSHLVQLLTVALAMQLSSDKSDDQLEEWLSFAGTSLKQYSRLMNSPPSLWWQIFSQNKAVILPALDGLCARLQELKAAIAEGDREAMELAFQKSARVYAIIQDKL